MDNLANVFIVTSGTLTSAPILSCTAVCKVTRLDAPSASLRLQDMTLSPHHYIIHDTRYGTFAVPSGSLSTTYDADECTRCKSEYIGNTWDPGSWDGTRVSRPPFHREPIVPVVRSIFLSRIWDLLTAGSLFYLSFRCNY